MSQKILLQTILRLQDQIKTGAANFMDVSAEYLKSTGNFLDGSLKNVALEEINKLAPSNVEDLSVIRTENFRTSPQGEGIMSKYNTTDISKEQVDADFEKLSQSLDRTYANYVNSVLVDLQKASPSEKQQLLKAIIGRKGEFKNLDDVDVKKLLNSVDKPTVGTVSPLRGNESFDELLDLKKSKEGLGSLYPKGKTREIFDASNAERDDLAGFMRAMRKAGIKNKDVMDVAKITDVAEGKRAATTLARAADMGADTKIKQEFLSDLDEKVMNNGPRYFQEEFQGYDSYGELIQNESSRIRNAVVDDLEELGVDEERVSSIMRYANDVAKRNPYQPEAFIEAIKQDIELEGIKYDMSFWENYISKILELSAKPATRFAGGGISIMIKNIINENLDQFGLPYGEGQRITPQNFVPTMPMRDPNYGIPAAADQMVFRPNTLYDSKIKNMYEMEKMGFPQKNLQDMKERDVEQFNKGKGPLSLPKDEYKGIKGYTAMAIDPNRMTDAYFGFFNTNPTTNRNFDRDFSQLPSYGDAVSGTNVQGMDLEMDPGAFINPNIQPSQNMFQRAGNAIQSGLGSIRDFAVDKGMSAKNLLGSGAAMAMGLPGIVGSGVMSLLGAFRGNPEQRARNEYNKQFSTGDIYGYGMGSASGANKDAFGYNTVSAFGNYEQHMKDKVEELEDLLEKTGRTGFKPGTYQFNILKDYTKNINKIQEDNRTRKEEEQIALANALARAQEEINRMGYQDYGSGGASAATQASYEGADGSYAGASTQDYGSGEKDGGIIGYQNGGLASMFVRRG